jgi:hypothetical protein
MFPPVTGAVEQLRLYAEGSSAPVTFRHDDATVQVPTTSPPHGVTSEQDAPPPAPVVWPLPPLPVAPPDAGAPPVEAVPPAAFPPLEVVLPPVAAPPLPVWALLSELQDTKGRLTKIVSSETIFERFLTRAFRTIGMFVTPQDYEDVTSRRFRFTKVAHAAQTPV